MKKNIIKELSKILEVSISTVSKALNDSYEISDKTKQRIKETARLYNYKPNKLAVNLKSGKTNTIGVILPSIKNFFLARILRGIENVIANTQYNIIISITNVVNVISCLGSIYLFVSFPFKRLGNHGGSRETS